MTDKDLEDKKDKYTKGIIVEERIDYAALERLYEEQMKQKSYCPHTDAISKDEAGCYIFDCKACGLYMYANPTTAARLGWWTVGI